jgi:hypothetical protein
MTLALDWTLWSYGAEDTPITDPAFTGGWAETVEPLAGYGGNETLRWHLDGAPADAFVGRFYDGQDASPSYSFTRGSAAVRIGGGWTGVTGIWLGCPEPFDAPHGDSSNLDGILVGPAESTESGTSAGLIVNVVRNGNMSAWPPVAVPIIPTSMFVQFEVALLQDSRNWSNGPAGMHHHTGEFKTSIAIRWNTSGVVTVPPDVTGWTGWTTLPESLIGFRDWSERMHKGLYSYGIAAAPDGYGTSGDAYFDNVEFNVSPVGQ